MGLSTWRDSSCWIYGTRLFSSVSSGLETLLSFRWLLVPGDGCSERLWSCNYSLGTPRQQQPSQLPGRRQVWVWSRRRGNREGRVLLLTSLQSSCLSQPCNFSGFCLETLCLSCITHESWDLININKANYVKLATDRRFFKRWNHNSHDQSVCVAWKLRAVLVCSLIFAFHYSYFPATCGKGVLKERNEPIDSDDYKEKSFSELYFFFCRWVSPLAGEGHAEVR